jgi:hypothetical protein
MRTDLAKFSLPTHAPNGLDLACILKDDIIDQCPHISNQALRIRSEIVKKLQTGKLLSLCERK